MFALITSTTFNVFARTYRNQAEIAGAGKSPNGRDPEPG
jgi:hypothetical protein